MWNTNEYQKISNEYYRESRTRSKLLSYVTAYYFNERKIITLLNQYLRKIQLDVRIDVTSMQLELWRSIFSQGVGSNTESQFKKEDFCFKEFLEEIDTMKYFQRSNITSRRDFRQLPWWRKAIYYTYKGALRSSNPFISLDVLNLFNEVAKRNRYAVKSKVKIDFKDILFGKHEAIELTLDNIGSIYRLYESGVESNEIRRILKKNEIYNSSQTIMNLYYSSEEFSAKKLMVSKRIRISFPIETKKGQNIETRARADSKRKSIVRQVINPMELVQENQKEETQSQSKKAVRMAIDVLFAEIMSVNRFKRYANSYSTMEITTGDKCRFYNFDISENRAKNLAELHFDFLFQIGCNFVTSNWDFVCYFLLLLYHFYNMSVTTLFIPFAVFIFGMTEEYNKTMGYWQTILLYVGIVFICKMFLISLFNIEPLKEFQPGEGMDVSFEKDGGSGEGKHESGLFSYTNYPSDQTALVISYLFGNLQTLIPDFAVFWALFLNSQILRKTGLKDKYLVEVENINQAFVRLKLNNFWSEILEEKKKTKYAYLDHIRKKSGKKRQSVANSLKEIPMQAAQKSLFFNILRRMDRVFNKNFAKFRNVNINNHLWRLFSRYNAKPGRDISKVGSVTLLVICLFIILFMTDMTREGQSFLESVENSQLSSRMVQPHCLFPFRFLTLLCE